MSKQSSSGDDITPSLAEQPKAGSTTCAITPAKLRDIGGSDDEDFNLQLTNTVLLTAWVPAARTPEERTRTILAIAAGMRAFAPRDAIEGMLAGQAMALHHAAMEWSRRAMIPDQGFEPGREDMKAAANSSRAFVELLAALDRKRGKGSQQKVTVEHVHVHAGGQAIVGSVAPASLTEAGGGGEVDRPAEEPRAPPAALEHDAAAGPVFAPLRSADQKWPPVPVARNVKRPLSNARRPQHRSENG